MIGPRDYRSLDVDCSLFACYFMLAAAARGLGTCWIALGSNVRNAELLREIGIPDDCRIVAPIIIGLSEKHSGASTEEQTKDTEDCILTFPLPGIILLS